MYLTVMALALAATVTVIWLVSPSLTMRRRS
jgi:hypothetical protein